jgi:hypothetical protein
MKRFSVVCILTALAASPALGDIFQWTDDKGVVHFTDDADRVPSRYKGKVRVQPTEPQAPAAKPAPAQPEQVRPVVVQPEPAGTTLYGGHDEGWWRGRFLELRGSLAGIQNGLPAKRERLLQLNRERVLYTRARDRVAYYDLQAEIDRDEAQIAEFQKNLQDLDREASSAGVPFDWRK